MPINASVSSCSGRKKVIFFLNNFLTERKQMFTFKVMHSSKITEKKSPPPMAPSTTQSDSKMFNWTN